MFSSSSPLDLPTHNIDSHYYGKSPVNATGAYSRHKSSPLRTIKQSLEIIFESKDSRQIFYFLLLNLSYMFVQLAYGVWTNSLGLISDAIHMFFDCLALGVGLFAAVMSKWPSNSEFSYGYSRIETVAAYFNGVFLVLISLSIITEAIQRLIHPPEMNTHRLLFISFVGLVVNLVGIFAFNHGHAHGHSHGGGHDHHHHGHDHGHSANMQGVFLHIMADTLGSAGVIVSTILIKWFGWTGFDPIASLFIAVLIMMSALPLIRQASAVMMLELDDQTVAAVEGTLDEVKSLEGVYSISHVRFWPCEAENIIGSLHVQVKDGVDTQLMRHRVTELLQSHLHGLREVCVQIELQSAVKKNRFTLPQKGFFHTPTYQMMGSGISSMNNAHVNHRPTAISSAPPSTVNLTLQQQQQEMMPPPPSNIQQQQQQLQPHLVTSVAATMSAASSVAASPSNIMSVLQKQTKKE